MKKLTRWIKREEGFTLIEMSLVLFIISALLLLFVPNIANRQAGASTTSDEAVITVLQSQVDMYMMDNGEAPETFGVMLTDKYLTSKQIKNATDNYNLSDKGEVTAKPVP